MSRFTSSPGLRIPPLVVLSAVLLAWLLAGSWACSSEEAEKAPPAPGPLVAQAPSEVEAAEAGEIPPQLLAELAALEPHTLPLDFEWRWQSVANEREGLEVDHPQIYTLVFAEDGSFAVRADCNHGRGRWLAPEDRPPGALALEVQTLTRAQCPPNSYSDRFVGLLDSVVAFQVDGGWLHLELPEQRGTMRFTPARGEDVE